MNIKSSDITKLKLCQIAEIQSGIYKRYIGRRCVVFASKRFVDGFAGDYRKQDKSQQKN